MRLLVFFSSSLICACAAAGPSTQESSTPESSVKEEKAIVDLSAADKDRIVAMVLTSQRKGFVSHDLPAYMEIWDKDARLISGRGANPGPYDLSLSLKEIEASNALVFVGTPITLSLETSEVEVWGNSKEAVLSWTVVERASSFSTRVGEQYKLRLSEGKWRVFENRHWILASGPEGMLEEVDPSEYEALDAEAARTSGNERVSALVGGGRLREAYDELKKLQPSGAETPESQFEYWKKLSTLAQRLGAHEDARASVCKARALKPAADLQAWKLALDCS